MSTCCVELWGLDLQVWGGTLGPHTLDLLQPPQDAALTAPHSPTDGYPPSAGELRTRVWGHPPAGTVPPQRAQHEDRGFV